MATTKIYMLALFVLVNLTSCSSSQKESQRSAASASDTAITWHLSTLTSSTGERLLYSNAILLYATQEWRTSQGEDVLKDVEAATGNRATFATEIYLGKELGFFTIFFEKDLSLSNSRELAYLRETLSANAVRPIFVMGPMIINQSGKICALTERLVAMTEVHPKVLDTFLQEMVLAHCLGQVNTA